MVLIVDADFAKDPIVRRRSVGWEEVYTLLLGGYIAVFGCEGENTLSLLMVKESEYNILAGGSKEQE